MRIHKVSVFTQFVGCKIAQGNACAQGRNFVCKKKSCALLCVHRHHMCQWMICQSGFRQSESKHLSCRVNPPRLTATRQSPLTPMPGQPSSLHTCVPQARPGSFHLFLNSIIFIENFISNPVLTGAPFFNIGHSL